MLAKSVPSSLSLTNNYNKNISIIYHQDNYLVEPTNSIMCIMEEEK